MVLPSFACFLILFSLPSLSCSSAGLYAQQAKKSNAPTASGSIGLETQIFTGVPPAAEIERKKILRTGRKMVSVYEHSIQEDSASNNGEAQCSFGKNCIHEGKGITNAKRKLKRRSLGQSLHVKMSGFVSLNADYHVPRPHPPKNN